MWPSQTKWFAKSSGTTSEKSKFIPVTRESLEDCHYKAGKDLLCLYYHNHPDAKLYKGKHLVVGGSAETNNLSSDSYFGDLSAILTKKSSLVGRDKKNAIKENCLNEGMGRENLIRWLMLP